MSDDVVSYEVREGLAHATIHNGKANVLSPAVIAGLDDALTRAEHAGQDDVGALIIAGTKGMLTGGFDLTVMMQGPREAGELVTAGGAFFTRVFGSAVPVVVACTGHAVAAGALLLLAADYRVGASGRFQIGLIETAKGMVLPRWAVELGRERLSPRYYQDATVGARMYDPIEAARAGFLDEVVEADEVLDVAGAAAARYAALPRGAYVGQLKMNRAERLERLQAAVDADRGLLFETR